MIQKKYKSTIAHYLEVSSDQISLYWRGRVGLYAILKALGVGKGDEVILPAFTCVVVPSAIKYLEATPIYSEIDPHTYNLDYQQVEQNISPRTKVILAQNTFGLSAHLDPLFEIAHRHQIKVVEDCAHGFGGNYNGKKNGTSADAAFFSTQWNKAFSTGIGGIVVCNDHQLAKKVAAIEQNLITPNWKEEWMLRLQLFLKKNILKPSIYWTALKAYRWATEAGWISGSSDGGEMDDATMPQNYLKGCSKTQAHEGIRALLNFEKNLAHRKKIATLYDQAFEQMKLSKVFIPDYALHTFIKYPFLVKDRTHFMRQAMAAKVPLGDWLNSPIHPIQEKYERWDYPYGKFPKGEFVSQHILNLPTDASISENEAKRIIGFLEKNKSALLEVKEVDR